MSVHVMAGGLLFLGLCAGVVYLVARKNWYVQAMLGTIAAVGGICAALGIRRWFLTNNLNAVILAAVGITAILGVAITTRLMYFRRPT
jgi:presenilin-like A22 family membrane protease